MRQCIQEQHYMHTIVEKPISLTAEIKVFICSFLSLECSIHLAQPDPQSQTHIYICARMACQSFSLGSCPYLRYFLIKIACSSFAVSIRIVLIDELLKSYKRLIICMS